MRRLASFTALLTVIMVVSIALAQQSPLPAPAGDPLKDLATWIQILLGVAALAAIFWRGGRVEQKQDSLNEKVTEINNTFKAHTEDDRKFHQDISSRVASIEGQLRVN